MYKKTCIKYINGHNLMGKVVKINDLAPETH